MISQTIAAEEVQHVRFSDLLEPRLVKILGIDLGDFPQSHPGRCNIDRGFGVMDCVLYPDLYVSAAEQQ